MTEEFAFNAPTFYDFNSHEVNHDHEKNDSYFEIDHENKEIIETEEVVQNIYEDITFEEIEENPNEEIKDEARDEGNESVFYSPVGNISVDGKDCQSTKKKIPKRNPSAEVKTLKRCASLDVLNNKEKQKPVKNEVKSLTKKLGGLKFNNKNSVKYASTENLAKSRTYDSSGKLTRTSSRDHLNKLAQPKYKFSSMENLRKNDYVSMAEAVTKFYKSTPIRFRSKPSMSKNLPSHFAPTIPQSPALKTKVRHRENTALTSEQRELLEYEKEQKFKIRARPVNKKILEPMKATSAAITKPPATVPQPFKLTQLPPKKVQPSPQKEIPAFHARPVPKSLHITPKLKAAEPKITIPETPNFVRRLKASINTNVEEPKKEEKSKEFQPTKTEPVPLSFEKRYEMVQKKKEALINKVLEEEKKAREFHARPAPRKMYSPAKGGNNSRTSVNMSGKTNKADETMASNSEAPPRFKARPPTVLYKKPFVPKHEENHIEVSEFQLLSDQRAKEREEFERKNREKEQLLEMIKQQEEENQRKKEEEERANFRKQTEYKAQPVKKYKPVLIQPSNKVTEPVSPNFVSNKLRHANKENIVNNH